MEANADFDGIDSEIARPRLPFNSPTVGATTTCDLSLARVFVFTVSQATTLAFTNVPSASFACRIRLLITNGSAFLITWPAAVVWLAGIKPTFKASGVDEVELLTKDAGTTWYATLRNLVPGVIYQNQSLSTTSTVTVNLASYTVPANALTVNGQMLRLTVYGNAVTQGATISVTFGATTLSTVAVTAGDVFSNTYYVVRTGAATQRANALNLRQAGAVTFTRTTPGETLSGTVVINFQGFVTSGGTLNFDGVMVEYLTVS